MGWWAKDRQGCRRATRSPGFLAASRSPPAAQQARLTKFPTTKKKRSSVCTVSAKETQKQPSRPRLELRLGVPLSVFFYFGLVSSCCISANLGRRVGLESTHGDKGPDGPDNLLRNCAACSFFGGSGQLIPERRATHREVSRCTYKIKGQPASFGGDGWLGFSRLVLKQLSHWKSAPAIDWFEASRWLRTESRWFREGLVCEVWGKVTLSQTKTWNG